MVKFSQTAAVIKDIFIKACIYFTVSIILLNIFGYFLNVSWFEPGMCFLFALASFFAGIAVQVYKLTKIPAFSRHIAFFILVYADFFLVVIPLSSYSTNQGSALYLSIAFAIVYLVIFGICIGIKSAVNAVRNKNLKYTAVYTK